MKSLSPFAALLSLCVGLPAFSINASAQTVRPTTITRVFWQDRETDRLSYADLITTDKWSIKRGWVKDFPAVDAATQDLGPMVDLSGVLAVGIRSTGDNDSQRGWVVVDTGVYEEPHGNHFHWKYNREPQVKRRLLNAVQDNPNRGDVFDRQFYLSPDATGGVMKASPLNLKNGTTQASISFPGGGSDRSLAVVNGTVAYATHNGGEGENVGRVDVVRLSTMPPAVTYSFSVPGGALRNTTVNSGKVFFATDDGICWVAADMSLSQSAESVQVNTLQPTNGDGDDSPLRTQAFANSGQWVVCSTGSGPNSALTLANSALSKPTVVSVPINAAEGLQLSAPTTVLSLGKRYAVVFQERMDVGSDVQEQLTIVDLDPNRDRNCADARVVLNQPVGASRISGRFGHHGISFDEYGRFAVYTEPADGILNVMSLQHLQVVARFRVDGTPDNIVAVGAPEHFH